MHLQSYTPTHPYVEAYFWKKNISFTEEVCKTISFISYTNELILYKEWSCSQFPTQQIVPVILIVSYSFFYENWFLLIDLFIEGIYWYIDFIDFI